MEEDFASDEKIEQEILEQKIAEEFDQDFVRILRIICRHISKTGLSLQEACILARIDFNTFVKKMELYPVIKDLIVLKELQFKADLLSTLADRARGGNDKIAQWFLEAKYADEFNKKKGSGGGGGEGDDLLMMGIEFIQKNGDKNALVSEKSGRALIVGKTTESITKQFNKFLQ
jgi:hypothetical protein